MHANVPFGEPAVHLFMRPGGPWRAGPGLKNVAQAGGSVSGEAFMGHYKGKDNAKKHATRRKKMERLAAAKKAAAAVAAT